MQANWIGKSHGVNIGFPYELGGEKKLLRVFTTRADTLMGATSARSRPSTRSAAHAAKSDPKLATLSRNASAPGDGSRPRPARQEGHADRSFRHASDQRRENRKSGSATTCSWPTEKGQ